MKVPGAVAVLVLSLSICGVTNALGDGQAVTAHKGYFSPRPDTVQTAGLWDKPNQACTDRCHVYVQKSCYSEQVKKNPTGDPASIQEKCDFKFSLCLYDCMCDTCDENQIILKDPEKAG